MRKALKKVMSIALTAAMSVSMLTVGAVTAQADDLKVGVILVGDETEGYTKAHMDGISQAAEELGMDESQIVWKYKVAEDSACYDSAVDLVGQGCNLVISNSYGHQTFMVMAAQEYPDTTFVSMTGDFAAISGCSNFKNAFTKVYESRYVSGVVAGMKLAELLESGTLTADVQPDSFDADGNVKIGYVGAYTYAEVVSGYTSFFLGVRHMCPSAEMEVTFTGSWYDETAEKEGATKLINDGCVLLSQHADSMGAPTACENAGIPDVSYNGSTVDACPNTFIVSSRIDWAPYYVYAITAAMNGESIDADWTGTLATESVVLTDINENVAAEGTAEKIEEVKAALESGELHVFDTSAFTVDGKTLDSYMADVDSDPDYTPDTEVISDGYFHESEYRSAQYFDLQIDGITLLDTAF